MTSLASWAFRHRRIVLVLWIALLFGLGAVNGASGASFKNDFKLPDFTVSYEGDTFYWEHLGMLSVPSYKEAWEQKRQWYEDNGYLDRIITSEDGSDGSINAAEIEQTARKKILLER